MTVSDDQRLDQTKPGSGMEANNVAQGMATLEQEQQLWRPGVKAEQVLVSHLWWIVFLISGRLYFSFLMEWISYPNHLYFQGDSW